MSFSLETASDYVKDEKACFYGFRCTVIGYEWPASHEQVGSIVITVIYVCSDDRLVTVSGTEGLKMVCVAL